MEPDIPTEDKVHDILTGLGRGAEGGEEDNLRAVLARMNPGDLQQIHDLQRQVADLKEAEKVQMDRLVNNIANLELKVRPLVVPIICQL